MDHIDETLSAISKDMELAEIIQATIAGTIELAAGIQKVEDVSEEEKARRVKETVIRATSVVIKYIREHDA